MNTVLFNYEVPLWKEGRQTGRHIPIILIHLVNIKYFYSKIKESLYLHNTPETTVHLRAAAVLLGKQDFLWLK